MVVCTSNQARSPVAAALFRDHFTRGPDDLRADAWWPVCSAGLDASEGMPLLASMAGALSRRGMTPFLHASRLLSPARIEGVRLIITMTEAHRHRVNRMSSSAVPRTFTLKELDRLLMSPQWERTSAPAGDTVGRLHALRPLVPRASEPEDVVDPASGRSRLADAVLDELVQLVGRVATNLRHASGTDRGRGARTR
jgi:protein-tyrosine phosphatase